MGTILFIHNFLALIALALLGGILIYYMLFLGKKDTVFFFKKGNYLSISTLFALHIQFLLGILLLCNYAFFLMKSNISFGEIMKNAPIRYKIIEHPICMFIGIVFATIAHIKLKKRKMLHTSSFVFFLLSLIFILGRLPFHLLLRR